MRVLKRVLSSCAAALLAAAVVPATALADDCSNMGDCYSTAGSAAATLGLLGLSIAFLYGIRAAGVGGGGNSGSGQGGDGASKGRGTSGGSRGSRGGTGGAGSGAHGGAGTGGGSGTGGGGGATTADYGDGSTWNYRPVPGREGAVNASVQHPDGSGEGYYTNDMGDTQQTWKQTPNGDGTFNVDFLNSDGSVRMQATISPNADGTSTITATNADGSSSQHVAQGNEWVASNGSVDPHPSVVPSVGSDFGDAGTGSGTPIGEGEAATLDTGGQGDSGSTSSGGEGTSTGSSSGVVSGGGTLGDAGSTSIPSSPDGKPTDSEPFETEVGRANVERRPPK